jgi:hypothetical protein
MLRGPSQNIVDPNSEQRVNGFTPPRLPHLCAIGDPMASATRMASYRRSVTRSEGEGSSPQRSQRVADGVLVTLQRGQCTRYTMTCTRYSTARSAASDRTCPVCTIFVRPTLRGMSRRGVWEQKGHGQFPRSTLHSVPDYSVYCLEGVGQRARTTGGEMGLVSKNYSGVAVTRFLDWAV